MLLEPKTPEWLPKSVKKFLRERSLARAFRGRVRIIDQANASATTPARRESVTVTTAANTATSGDPISSQLPSRGPI